ncbi:M48 family metallopeptidase [Fusobacterium nucleatum]|jgi:Predicted metal-dependent hydrolase|uniref:Possible metal-dependent hydrolase n=1 Tax=Fusobacterium polymorphum ATCC 10953 TaxID=393480 RepID=A5TUV9_FUSNP|nr:possible metal-dependent hydrolase [Fusobacterium polymorphum ATCC 10953]MBW9310151.1 M48 family metallopeptidase [Fusobacterium nucleatum]
MIKICYNIIRSDKVEYTVTKKKIKNFIIRIYPDLRIAVSVPLHASNKDIENFIQSKKEWIETILEKIKVAKENKNTLKESSIKILGKEIDKKIIESDLERIRLTNTSIYIYSKEIDNTQIDKKLLEWKVEKLKAILDEYLNKYTKLLNINIDYYQIKKLSSAWGIYHKKENYISFNSDLIEKDIDCIEYVVLHELCHIFYMNHQKDFWALVEKYMPDYKVRRKNLKTFI